MSTSTTLNNRSWKAVAVNPWEERRNRAALLAERYSYAAEILQFYRQLTQAQENLWQLARTEQPAVADVPEWAVKNKALQTVIRVTQKCAPLPLVEAATIAEELPEDFVLALMTGYLGDAPLPEVENCSREAVFFLARANLGPVLEALDLEPRLPTPLTGEERTCPWCGGLPQCKILLPEGEYNAATVQLVCARCCRSWNFKRRTCAVCGESGLNQLALFEADDLLPHLRLDGCRTCNHYLATVDLRRDGQAVPLVDELCALPLDLWATEQGFSKVQANLMGV